MFISKLHNTQSKFSRKEGNNTSPQVETQIQDTTPTTNSEKTQSAFSKIKKAAVIGAIALGGVNFVNEAIKFQDHKELMADINRVEHKIAITPESKKVFGTSSELVFKHKPGEIIDEKAIETLVGNDSITSSTRLTEDKTIINIQRRNIPERILEPKAVWGYSNEEGENRKDALDKAVGKIDSTIEMTKHEKGHFSDSVKRNDVSIENGNGFVSLKTPSGEKYDQETLNQLAGPDFEVTQMRMSDTEHSVRIHPKSFLERHVGKGSDFAKTVKKAIGQEDK
jgi:hypothetical protein